MTDDLRLRALAEVSPPDASAPEAGVDLPEPIDARSHSDVTDLQDAPVWLPAAANPVAASRLCGVDAHVDRARPSPLRRRQLPYPRRRRLPWDAARGGHGAARAVPGSTRLRGIQRHRDPQVRCARPGSEGSRPRTRG